MYPEYHRILETLEEHRNPETGELMAPGCCLPFIGQLQEAEELIRRQHEWLVQCMLALNDIPMYRLKHSTYRNSYALAADLYKFINQQANPE